MKRSDFIFDSVQRMYYKCHKVNVEVQAGRKRKKATIKPENTDDKCFQDAVNVALNYGEIELHPERVSNIRSL